MNIDDIIVRREQLDYQLRVALTTMERKNTIAEIRKEIIENQKSCPHFSTKYNWTVVDGVCPYCGQKLVSEKRDY